MFVCDPNLIIYVCLMCTHFGFLLFFFRLSFMLIQIDRCICTQAGDEAAYAGALAPCDKCLYTIMCMWHARVRVVCLSTVRLSMGGDLLICFVSTRNICVIEHISSFDRIRFCFGSSMHPL